MPSAQGWAIGAAALAWTAGVALQLQQAVLQPWPLAPVALGGAAVLAGLAWIAAGRRDRAALALGLMALLLAGWASTEWRAGQRLAQVLTPTLEGLPLVVTGRVADLPQTDADGLRVRFAVEQAEAGGRAVSVPALIWLAWGRGWQEDPLLAPAPADLAGGERWRLAVTLRRPHGSLNPDGFDAELWLFEQGVGAVGTVRADAAVPPQRLAPARAWVPAESLPALRQWLRDRLLLQVADARAAGVLAALAVGDQSAIDSAGWDVFRATGVAHLMSISGLHITLFAWLAARWVGSVWRRAPRLMAWLPAPLAARWGGLLLALAYSALAGWGVPAQRTVGMLALAVLVHSVGLRWPPLLLGLLAGAGVSLLDPWALLQPGFWLSFMAVGLLMLSDGAVHTRPPTEAPGWARVRSAVLQGLRTQVLATLGLAPLSMLLFQQLSLVGLLANLLAVPVVTFVVTPLALAGLLWPPLQGLSAAALAPVLLWLEWLAQQPWAVWAVPVVPLWAAMAALVAALLFVLPLPWSWRGLGAPLLLPLLWPALPRPAPGQFELVVADVGQGSAVLVRTAEHLLLHDAGPVYGRDSDAGRRVLTPLLQARGERRIDELVLSHRDTDHVGGAAHLIGQWPVVHLRSSLVATHPLRQRGLAHTACVAGQQWTWDGVRFQVLHPLQADLDTPGLRPNALSCVLRVEDAAGRALLLTGDIEAAQEAALLARASADLRADWLVVPHHGSQTSSTEGFLGAVGPHTALVQAGYRNRFGHPHPAVLARFEALGIKVVRTDRCGAWVWGGGSAECTRDVHRRYWHWRETP